MSSVPPWLPPWLSDALSQPVVDVPTAGRALGIPRGSAYAAARNGNLPVIRTGRRMVVPTAWLRSTLHLDDEVEGEP
jgi:hypothetical protein